MIKDFDKWNNKKKYLDKKSRDLIFNEGEVWWSYFGVNIGQEAYGKGEDFRRPVIILKKITDHSCIVIPTTTKIKEGPNFYKFITRDKERRAMLYQIKFISTNRLRARESEMNKADFKRLKESLASLLEIPLWPPSGQYCHCLDQWVSPDIFKSYQIYNCCQIFKKTGKNAIMFRTCDSNHFTSLAINPLLKRLI